MQVAGLPDVRANELQRDRESSALMLCYFVLGRSTENKYLPVFRCDVTKPCQGSQYVTNLLFRALCSLEKCSETPGVDWFAGGGQGRKYGCSLLNRA
jgi:hypothetical protein